MPLHESVHELLRMSITRIGGIEGLLEVAATNHHYRIYHDFICHSARALLLSGSCSPRLIRPSLSRMHLAV
jgi:hypothetical protein